jgi:integrase/recombinase XerC
MRVDQEGLRVTVTASNIVCGRVVGRRGPGTALGGESGGSGFQVRDGLTGKARAAAVWTAECFALSGEIVGVLQPVGASVGETCIIFLMQDEQDVSVRQLAAEFLAARATRKPSPHTLDAYRRDLTAVLMLVDESGDTPLGSLTPRALRAAFARFATHRSPASVHRAWSTWNSFFTFLVADDRVAGNPMSAVDRPRAVPPAPKPLRGEDTPERLLAGVADSDARQRHPWPERDVAVVALALCAGLRLAELLALRVGDRSGRAGERRLEVVGKGGRPRVVPVEPELDAVLDRYVESRARRFGARSVRPEGPLLVDRHGVALRRGGLQYLVESCFRRAGVADRVPRGAQLHALRHTFASRLAEDGATASEIMRLLGHASLTTSQGYIEVTGAQQRAAVRSLRTNQALRALGQD